jgi:hypothetical protein
MSARVSRRVAWMVFAIVLVLSAVDIVFFGLTYKLQAQSSWANNSLWVGFGFGLMMLAFPLCGAVIATRRPELPIGWLLLTIGLGWALSNATSYSDYGLRLHPGSLPLADYAAVLGSVMWVPTIGLTGTHLLLLFPDGRLPGRRWRFVAYLSALGIAVGSAALILTPGRMTDAGYPHTENPIGVSALGSVTGVAQAALILIPVAIVGSAASLIVRYRRSSALERQQIKWLAASAAVVAAIYLIVMPLSLVSPSSSADPAWLQAAQAIALLSFGLIPVAIGVAVLRHGLYTIDVIIRKTIVYAALIVSLALLYIGGVYAIEGVVRTVSGQSGTLAVTLSTLMVAVAFQPLRSRIQRAVDQRFYRARYDASRTLEAFTGRMRDQVDLETLSDEVLEVVRGALHPSHATLWLRSTGDEHRIVS